MNDLRNGYKTKLVGLLKALRETGINDTETVWLIGSLTTDLVDRGKAGDWQGFKQGLSGQAYDDLLESLETQRKQLAANGRDKAVFAIEVLAYSLAGQHFATPETEPGVALLDDLITMAMQSARQHRAATGRKYPTPVN